jgi:hypothetical protein
MKFLIVPPEQMMVVDNAVVAGMNLSALTDSLIIWNGVSGEIEPANAMPVRTAFKDPTPYLSYINAWIAAPVTISNPPVLDPGIELPLKLTQAKRIKTDLIETLFALKRQAPIAWASWTWDASDESLRAMLLALIPVSTQAVGSLVNDFNNQMAVYNSNLSTNFANYIATWVPTPTLYNVFGSSFNQAGPNYGFGIWAPTQPPPVKMPGNPPAYGAISAGSVGAYLMPAIGAVSDPLAGAGAISWLPYNSASGVSITYAQLGTIVTSITARRNSLYNVRETKKAQVQALNTIAAVAAYNVTTGW